MLSPGAPNEDATIPATLVESQPGASVVVMPAVEESSDKLAKRDQVLKDAMGNGPVISPTSPVAPPPDYEKMAEELTEDQVQILMSKFNGVANGEVGCIEPDKLPEGERQTFFGMLENFVLSNRKKIPAANAKPIKGKPVPKAPPPVEVAKPAEQSALTQPEDAKPLQQPADVVAPKPLEHVVTVPTEAAKPVEPLESGGVAPLAPAVPPAQPAEVPLEPTAAAVLPAQPAEVVAPTAPAVLPAQPAEVVAPTAPAVPPAQPAEVAKPVKAAVPKPDEAGVVPMAPAVPPAAVAAPTPPAVPPAQVAEVAKPLESAAAVAAPTPPAVPPAQPAAVAKPFEPVPHGAPVLPAQPAEVAKPHESAAVPAQGALVEGTKETAATSTKSDENAVQLAAVAPPNRELELAGLQALMAAQKQREAAAAANQELRDVRALQVAKSTPRIPLTAGTERIDWTTHKREGMRLKRLCEESGEGDKYPHMKKLFNEGTKEDCASCMEGVVPQDL